MGDTAQSIDHIFKNRLNYIQYLRIMQIIYMQEHELQKSICCDSLKKVMLFEHVHYVSYVYVDRLLSYVDKTPYFSSLYLNMSLGSQPFD